jgi:hypothetical protein
MANKKNEFPNITCGTWDKPQDQHIKIGGYTYQVSSLIFESRDLQIFKMPMAAVNFEAAIGNPNTQSFVQHMKAVLNADMSYPIIFDPAGRLLDGRHRIAKALHEEREYILAVRFNEYPSAKTYNKDEE